MATDVWHPPQLGPEDSRIRRAFDSLGEFVPTTIDAAIVVALTPAAFVAATYAGTWASFGGGYAAAGYYKDPFGIVHLRGAVGGGGAATIFTLPAGYRPAFPCVFAQMASGGTINQVQITTAGVVTDDTATPAFLSLDGITFRSA